MSVNGIRPPGVAVFGSTGSCGHNALDVIARHPDRYRVEASSADGDVDALWPQVRRLEPRYAALAAEPALQALRARVEAARAGGTAGALLNAANEIAVERFPSGALSFTHIAAAVEETLAEGDHAGDAGSLEGLLTAERSAGTRAAKHAGRRMESDCR